MDFIIYKVKVLPDIFEQFCSVLFSESCFRELIDDMSVFYIIVKNETEIQALIQIDKVLLYLQDQLNANQRHALSVGGSRANKEEYFTKILLDRPKFARTFMEYLTRQDCPGHTKLYHWLQSSVDSFKKLLPSILNNCVSSLSAPLKRYQDHLKKTYITHFKLVEQSGLEGPKIHHYINLSLITPDETETIGDFFKAIVDPYNIFFKHKEQKSNTKLKSLSDIFDASEVGRQVILVQGSPGTGKTTLANKLCQEWAAGKLLQNYKLVILLKLRHFRLSDTENIRELIYYSTDDQSFAHQASREIESINGEGMLLLLEGWDELPEVKQSDFFAKVISGRVLKNASVLITSRPSSIGSIQKGFVTRNIAILGFSNDQIEQYLDCCFPMPSNERVNKLKRQFLDQLSFHLALKSLACIPVNLSILVSVFQQCGGRLPSSLTELYEQYLLLKLGRHYQRTHSSDIRIQFPKLDMKILPKVIGEKLDKLGKLAYHKLKEGTLTFGEDDIKKYCFLCGAIPLDFDGMGLLQIENDILNKSTYRTYHFLHRTVQEFLAAWYLSQKSQQKQEEHLKEIFDNNTFEMVWVFYAGITGFKSVEIKSVLSDVIPMVKALEGTVKNIYIDIGSKVLVKSRNAPHIVIMSGETRDYYRKAVSKFVSNEFLLVLITCCAEAQNPAACQALSSSRLFYKEMCYIKIPESSITPQVLSSLSYCIICSGKRWVIDCLGYLQHEDILNLHKYFDSTSISGELTTLFTYTSKYQVEYFMMLIQSHCGLSHLDISFSKPFDDFCTKLLAETLKHNRHLIILGLRGCNISSTGIRAIAEMLLKNSTLEWLDLECNPFTTTDLMQVLVMIKGTNTSLSLMEVDDTLVDDNVKLLLSEFNEGRKISLRLNCLHAIFKGSHSGIVVEWGVKKYGKVKSKVKAALKDILE